MKCITLGKEMSKNRLNTKLETTEERIRDTQKQMSNKREIHIITGLSQETKNSQINNLTLHLKKILK